MESIEANVTSVGWLNDTSTSFVVTVTPESTDTNFTDKTWSNNSTTSVFVTLTSDTTSSGTDLSSSGPTEYSTDSFTTPVHYYDYLPYVPTYDDYIYSGFGFERPVYLYIWEIIVILTCLTNAVVIFILLQRKMRNPTNVVLVAIAVTDSLTGLSTLPSYIMVYDNYEPPFDPKQFHQSYYEYPSYPSKPAYPPNQTYPNVSGDMYGMSYDYGAAPSYGAYSLTKNECRWFMFTKFFLSKSFHSMSIFLTLFLAIQRFISVAAPFRAQALTTTKALLTCLLIVILSPSLHVFHLVDEKAEYGLCEWDMPGKGCKGGCIELWFMFFLRNFIPCSALLLFTILFIRELHKGEANIRRMDSTRGQIARRVEENRRIIVIVTAIVIVFLIPEIPFGFYLLYNAIDKTANNGENMDLKTNRAIHMTYEILMVLSFEANFFIYVLFNRKFRVYLLKIFVQPMRRYMGDTRRVSVSSTSFNRSTQRKTELLSMKSSQGSNTVRTTMSNSLSDRCMVESTAFMHSASVDITDTSHQNYTDTLNANV